jgi:3-oxoacyl-(acyl-carrier-protein) synthase III
VYALVTAAQFIAAGSVRRALVVAADVNSTIVDPRDQKVTPLFGDGAGAVVVGRVNHGSGLLGFHMGADGGGGGLFFMPAGGSRRPATFETVEAREHYIRMDGPSLFRFGVDAMVQASRSALDRAGLTIDQVDLFIPHQANLRIIDAGIERLGIPKARTLVTLDRFHSDSARRGRPGRARRVRHERPDDRLRRRTDLGLDGDPLELMPARRDRGRRDCCENAAFFSLTGAAAVAILPRFERRPF